MLCYKHKLRKELYLEYTYLSFLIGCPSSGVKIYSKYVKIYYSDFFFKTSQERINMMSIKNKKITAILTAWQIFR